MADLCEAGWQAAGGWQAGHPTDESGPASYLWSRCACLQPFELCCCSFFVAAVAGAVAGGDGDGGEMWPDVTAADRPVVLAELAAGFRSSRERPVFFRLMYSKRCIRCTAVADVVVAAAVGRDDGDGGGCGSICGVQILRRCERERYRHRRRRPHASRLPGCRRCRP